MCLCAILCIYVCVCVCVCVCVFGGGQVLGYKNQHNIWEISDLVNQGLK